MPSSLNSKQDCLLEILTICSACVTSCSLACDCWERRAASSLFRVWNVYMYDLFAQYLKIWTPEIISIWIVWFHYMSSDMTKTNKLTVRPAKTQISLGICPVWLESSLCTQWVAKDPRFLHVDSKDSDQTGRMPKLIWVFAGSSLTLLVLSCRGSYIIVSKRCRRNGSVDPNQTAFVIMLVFYGPRHFSGHFGLGRLSYPHCSWTSPLGSLPVLSVRSFASNWQLPFLNQPKGENGRRNYFMTNLHERMLPDVRIEPPTIHMPDGCAFDWATMPGQTAFVWSEGAVWSGSALFARILRFFTILWWTVCDVLHFHFFFLITFTQS